MVMPTITFTAEHHLQTNHKIAWDSVECVIVVAATNDSFEKVGFLTKNKHHREPMPRATCGLQTTYQQNRQTID